VELVSYEIRLRERDHDPIVVAPIGDCQWSGKRGPTAQDTFKRHIDRCMALNAYFIGMGDYIDFMSPSNRQRLKGAALYDTAEDVVDDKAMELVQELYDMFLRPTKGRWIGLLEGHHFSALKTGETTDQRLCQMLDARFLGTCAYVKLQFVYPSRGTRANVTLWCHHGVGGGQTQGAPLNKLSAIAAGFGGADVYLMGHTTKMPATRTMRVYPRWHGRGAPDLVHKEVLEVNTGGFSKSYILGSKQGRVPRGGYAEQGMMPPSALGAPVLMITPGMAYSQGLKTWAPEIRVEL
jgi:hypothetical protein